MLKMPEARVRSFAKAGLIGSTGHKSLRFDFRDMMVLRMARGLAEQGLAHRQVQRALRALRDSLPPGRPLSGVTLSLNVPGRRVLACVGNRAWDAESGQYELPLQGEDLKGGLDVQEQEAGLGVEGAEKSVLPANVSALHPHKAPAIEPGDALDDGFDDKGTLESAQGWFDIGVSLEEHDVERAYQAYLRALACDPEHTESMINLGRLSSAAGEATRAVSYFRLATLVDPEQAVGHFNLGVTLHDMGDLHAAALAYEQALTCDAQLADAHYNLATLLEERGDGEVALYHMAAYRRLVEDEGE